MALLAALEFVNPAMPATIDAAALTQMNRRGQITGAYLEGPIAMDVPFSRFAAKNIGGFFMSLSPAPKSGFTSLDFTIRANLRRSAGMA